MKHLSTLMRTGLVLSLLVLPSMALAATENPFQNAQKLAGQVGENAGLGQPKPLTQIIGNLINVALGFLGIVLLAYLLYGGFKYMTAQGEKGNVETAISIIRTAIVGLIIIVAAFAISTFVLASLVNATNGA